MRLSNKRYHKEKFKAYRARLNAQRKAIDARLKAGVNVFWDSSLLGTYRRMPREKRIKIMEAAERKRLLMGATGGVPGKPGMAGHKNAPRNFR